VETSRPTPNQEQTDSPLMAGLPITQEPTVGKSIAIWLLVALVFILLGTIGVFTYKYYELKQQIDDKQLVQSTTPVISSIPTLNLTASWKTYANEKDIFTIKYPADWEPEIISPTITSTDPSTNEQVYSGVLKFSGPQGYLQITYGDGFGGGLCSSLGGRLETFNINQKEVNLCYRQLQNGIHSWGSCGDCTVVKLDSSKLTSYDFKSELNLSYSDSYSFLSQILSTFKSPN